MQVIVDSLAIQYSQVGSASKVVVLLHGWGDAASSFTALAKNLSKYYTVITPDLPGFGGSAAPPEAWRVQNYADWVGSFLRKLDVMPYAVVGHSNGGTIALYGLAHNCFVAQKLVLLASAGVRRKGTAKKLALRIAVKPLKTVLKVLPGGTQRRVKQRAYSALGSDLYVAEHMQDTFKQVVSYDILNDAQGVNQPTLLLYGDQDTATPPHYGKLIAARMAQAELVIVANAGHFVHHDAPEEVMRRTTEFLK